MLHSRVPDVLPTGRARRAPVWPARRAVGAALALLLPMLGGVARAEPGLRFSFLAAHEGKAVRGLQLNDAGDILGRSGGLSLVIGFGGVRVLDGDAVALNNLGQAAGTRDACATVWAVDGSARCLAGLGRRALDLNDRGDVLGAGNRLWSGGVVSSLDPAVEGRPDLDAADAARRLNAAGQVLGVATMRPADPASALPAYASVVWSGGVARATSLVSTINANVGDLNATGDVAATVYDPSHGFVAMLDRAGTGTPLADLDGVPGWSFANGLNDRGDVVGRSAGLAVRWTAAGVEDLNAWLPQHRRAAGWVLTDATDVNADGSVLGTAFNTTTNRERSFVLWAAPEGPAVASAVPEPSGLATAATGLLALGAAVRRRGRAVAGRG